MGVIDSNFIRKWEREYDSHESDEQEYQLIIENTVLEIKQSKSISKETFLRILNWKSPRLKGIVKLNEFDTNYAPVIEDCIEDISNEDKINKIISLYGIAIPTGTTILHFIFPDVFPIMDIRTAEALYYLEYLECKGRTEKDYYKFYEVIHKIKMNTNMSLREIDRALFSYHKTEMNMNSLPRSFSQRSIDFYISEYHNMTNEEFMIRLSEEYIDDEYQRTIFLKQGVWTKVRLNYIAGLVLTLRNREIFTPKEIREIIREEIIPSVSEIDDTLLSGLILTQDVHKEAKQEYNNCYPCLEKVGYGKYRFIGFPKKLRASNEV